MAMRKKPKMTKTKDSSQEWRRVTQNKATQGYLDKSTGYSIPKSPAVKSQKIREAASRRKTAAKKNAKKRTY